MFEIALYNTLRKIPEVSDDEAKEAVADVASSKEVVTKADIIELKVATKADIVELKAEMKADIKNMATKADIANLETRMTWKLVGIGLAIVGIIKYL